MAKILLGFLLVWVVLDRSAALLGSFRGEAGVVVFLLVLVTATCVEVFLFGARPVAGLRALAFRAATRRNVVATLALSALFLCYFPLFAGLTDLPLALRVDWSWLLPGLFLQGGIAEEILFRGYLFRHAREGRGFWHAAFLSMIPFVAVHLLLFITLDFVIAAASLVLSVSMSFPLAWMFERAGNSIWPPAILHFLVQGAIKLVEVPDSAMATMAMGWIALSAIAPWALFALRPQIGETVAARPAR
jgi:membrane protease YdiL (CAAX protease family)